MKFIRTTIGLFKKHELYKRSNLVRCEYYELGNGLIKMVAVSGNDLRPMGRCNSLTITREEYENIPESVYDSGVEARAALGMLGWN